MQEPLLKLFSTKSGGEGGTLASNEVSQPPSEAHDPEQGEVGSIPASIPASMHTASEELPGHGPEVRGYINNHLTLTAGQRFLLKIFI